MKLEEIPVIIPSLEPNESLIDIVKDIQAIGMRHIIIVNDGSSDKYKSIFETVEKFESVTILRHHINLGKGRALKTAFNFCLNTFADLKGVVTADSDGQHTAQNIKDCAEALIQYNDQLILGVRDFSSSEIPFRSRFGNKLTVVVLSTLCGIKIADSQTGLRGIPKAFMKKLLTVHGERFEFETNMIIESKEAGVQINQIPIETIYQEKEEYSSHFNPIKDSLRIYSIFGKFIFSSMISTLLDIMLFSVFICVLKGDFPNTYILFSTISARIFSSMINFFVNKKMVFKNKSKNGFAAVKYALLCIFIMMCSAGFVTILHQITSIKEVFLKILVDTCLFVISFIIQREYIFNKKN